MKYDMLLDCGFCELEVKLDSQSHKKNKTFRSPHVSSFPGFLQHSPVLLGLFCLNNFFNLEDILKSSIGKQKKFHHGCLFISKLGTQREDVSLQVFVGVS